MAWKNVKTVFEVRFTRPFSAIAGKNELVRLLSDGKKNIPFNDSVNIKDDDKKLSIGVAADRIGIIIESGDYTKDMKLAIAAYKKISSAYSLPTSSRIGIRRFAYLDVEEIKDYDSFVDKYKEIFYRPSALTSAATDVAVSLFIDGSPTANLNIGPMREDEIKHKFLEFEPSDDSYPDFYLFLDMDIFKNEATELTNSSVKRFIDESEQYFHKYSKMIDKEWSDE